MRVIDADALLSDIERSIEESGCANHEGEIMDCVRYASEVDAVPVVRGEWIVPDDTVIACICSVCDWESNLYEDDVMGMPYCPNCGAKMDKESESNGE
jgi:hypothetical protein